MRPNIGVLRSAILPMLTETGKVERETGETTQDPNTGSETPVVETVFNGPVLVQPRYQQNQVEAGGTTVVVGKYDLTLPADTPVIRGDVLKVTDAPFDAALVGADFHILDVPLDPWQVARFVVAERFT